MNQPVNLYLDEELGRYGFLDDHPLGGDRQAAFRREAAAQQLLEQVVISHGRRATDAEIARFHTRAYIDEVASAEAQKRAALDAGDTPIFPDIYAVSAYVVGAALSGLATVMDGAVKRTLQPIGGLHHAARDHAAGFCVFNDLGVVIETLRQVYQCKRIAYVDIDAHHGDGVFYAFETDPELIFADLHQDSRTLYPGTGRADEIGKGSASGTKLNIEMPPFATDADFLLVWPRVEAHLAKFEPEFIIFQCGADSVQGDPLAQLAYTPAAHAHATTRLRAVANKFAQGRLMAFGGGGYDRGNLGRAWSAVLRELLVT
ncbi:MAG: acetoin utilization protein AcuC [Gammaproteobacteria bacterium]|nr:acetoin utilization protein AcuC [Gammaproteobacteria bacterium]